MKAYLAFVAVLLMAVVTHAATNNVLPVRTDFARGRVLSADELRTVVELANTCGIRQVTEVATELRLGGTLVRVSGDENLDGRSVCHKLLHIYPQQHRRTRLPNALTAAGFWADPNSITKKELTILKASGREVRVELAGGIKPAGGDQMLEALVKGEIQCESEHLKSALAEVDLLQPRWIGLAGGRLEIIFAARLLTTWRFTFQQGQLTLVDRIEKYE